MQATLTPGPGPVDAYVVLQVPGGALWSLTLKGGLVPGVVPIARAVTPFAFSEELLEHEFTGAEPWGSCPWLSGLTRAGTGTLIGDIDETRFRLYPFLGPLP